MGSLLLVDDDVLVRRVVRTFLERAGYCVTEATNGVEGLELFEAERPALVLTDILMPRMNGFEMMVEMRQRRRDVAVIAMTGSAYQGDADSMLLLARDLGAIRTFRKPLDMTRLLEAVGELMPRE